MGSDDLDRAMSLLKRADAADKQCARVSIMFGRIYMAQNDYAKAAESLQRVLSRDKELVSETLPMLQECYAHLPEQQHNWAEFLKRCVEENTGATADLMLAEIIEQHEGRDVVQVYINRQLQRHPTMRVFYRLMDYHGGRRRRPGEREPAAVARHGRRANSHQAALPLPQMRLHRALALLALPVVPRPVIG